MRAINKRVARTNMIELRWVLVVPTRRLPMRMPIPKIKKTLMTLEPMKLPIARPKSDLRVATVETASSGREVPMAIRVVAIIKGETPRAWERREARRTKNWVESRRKTTPKVNWSRAGDTRVYCTMI